MNVKIYEQAHNNPNDMLFYIKVISAICIFEC